MTRLIAALTVLALYVAAPAAPISVAALGYVPRGEPTEHTFLVKSTVARWDPCTPIGWRVNLQGATRGALSDTRAAFWRLGQITGLTFRYRGATLGVPQWDGNAWYPADTQIIVAWVRPSRSTLFDASMGESAVAAPNYRTGYSNPDGSSAWRIVSASVVIDSRLHLAGAYGWGLTRGDLLLHELGHVMGLAHYPSTAEMMYPVMTRGRARYGRGDIAGLEEHGARMGCLTQNATARGGQ